MGVETIDITAPQLGVSIGKWLQEVTVSTAFDVLGREVVRGFDNEPVVVTDGVVKRDPRQVKAFGKIEFIARTTIADAVLWAQAELQKKSPVLTGRYASSHIIRINDVEVKGNIRVALTRVKAGDRVQIVNTQPYARKIEGATASKRSGRARRRASSRQARGGVYRPVLRMIVQRWGKSVYVEYKLIKLPTGVKVWGLQGGGKNRKKVRRDQVYPALSFYVKAGVSQVN